MNREANLRAMADGGPFDVLLIGGGIIGAGCARDLTTRGLRVALVEARDFGHGTTARSTRLIHGGLRYLEQRDFALVRESLRERERLLRNAPHLVQPLLFVTPLYAGGRHNRPLLKVGMTLYDALSYDKSLPGHRTYDAAGILRLEPGLSPEGLLGGATYSDGQVELPERLCWENVLATHQGGGAVANHARVTRLLREGDPQAGAARVVGALVQDERSGATFPVRAPLTVNTTGPWVEEALGEMLGFKTEKRFLRRTKGVHLVVPKFTDHAVVLVAGSDGRVFFVVPWRGFSVVGTTDTDFTGSLDDVAADANDVAYLQAETRRHFPRADVDTVYYTWAGVRALVLERSRQGMNESQVSRKDKIHDHGADGIPGLVTVLGGKITAYRAIAEQLGAFAVRLLGRGGPSRTGVDPYPGKPITAPPPDLDRYTAGLRGRLAGFGINEAHTLVRTHGTAAENILQLAKEDPALARRVVPDAFEILAQVAYAAREEMAVTLGDALLRRTGIGFGPRQGLDGLADAARVMAHVHGWDEARTRAEMDAYRREVEPMRRFTTAPA
jgi:glycerol-3-phosphate dehydrogenase